MSYAVTKYPQGTFSWADISSTDIEASKKFLTELFGWKAEDMPTGIPGMDYTMFYMDEKVAAGGSPMPEDMKEIPSHWKSYVTVDDVDAMTAEAERLGAKVTMKPMDVPMDSGRFSAIQDPTGADVMLWQPKKHIGAQIVNTVGAMGWNELYTRDLKKAQDFYSRLLGWTYEVDEKSGYVMIKNKGRANGGMMAITPEMKDMPSKWMVYFTVKNIEKSVGKVREMGGVVYMGPKETSAGKLAIIADTTGASIVIIELSMPPEEWTDS